jgi:hypothetical protein
MRVRGGALRRFVVCTPTATARSRTSGCGAARRHLIVFSAARAWSWGILGSLSSSVSRTVDVRPDRCGPGLVTG